DSVRLQWHLLGAVAAAGMCACDPSLRRLCPNTAAPHRSSRTGILAISSQVPVRLNDTALGWWRAMVVTHREPGRNRWHPGMSPAPPPVLAIACVAAALSFAPRPLAAQASVVPSEAGPRYRADGKDADAYGRKEGYPACTGMAYVREDRCRVGALSHFDTSFLRGQLLPPRSRACSRARRVNRAFAISLRGKP